LPLISRTPIIVRDQRSRRHVRKAVLRECLIVSFPATPGARISGLRAVDSWLAEHGLEADALEELLSLMKAAKTAPVELSNRSRENDLPPRGERLIMAIDDCEPIDSIAAARAAWDDLKTALALRKGIEP
jgi:hypothetical protein